MGNSSLKFENNEYSYYSTQVHPIEGQVDVYRVEGDCSYVMRKINIQSDEVISIANNVQKLHSPYLIRYYGHRIPESSTLCTQIIKTISVTTYWEYLNHDMLKDTQLNKNVLKQEKKIWNVIGNCCQGGKVLNENGLAVQFNEYNVQFSPEKIPKLYWANLEKANMHRSYFRYFEGNQNKNSLYSPQEMYSMKINVLNRTINLQKCSIYSLGILMLSYIQGLPPQQFYNYNKFTINCQVYQKSFEFLRQNYSSYLSHVLRAMTQLDPLRRINFEILTRMVKSTNYQLTKLTTDNRSSFDYKKTRQGQKISFKS